MLDFEKLGYFVAAWRTKDRITNELYMQLWAMHMYLTTLLQLKHKVDTNSFLAYILVLQDEETGLFRNTYLSLPDLAATHFALSILDYLGKLELAKMPHKIVASIYELLTDDEGFMNDSFTRETDSRITFYAVCALSRLNRLLGIEMDSEVGDKIERFIVSTFNADGGAGARSGGESHAMQIYVGVGTFALLGRQLPEKLKFEATMYLMQCRTLTGGFCGRPGKLPDACYAMWCATTLELLGIYDYGRNELLEFIEMCQDPETGGIADRPENEPDLFHSHYCLAWYCVAFRPAQLPKRDALLDNVQGHE